MCTSCPAWYVILGVGKGRLQVRGRVSVGRAGASPYLGVRWSSDRFENLSLFSNLECWGIPPSSPGRTSGQVKRGRARLGNADVRAIPPCYQATYYCCRLSWWHRRLVLCPLECMVSSGRQGSWDHHLTRYEQSSSSSYYHEQSSSTPSSHILSTKKERKGWPFIRCVRQEKVLPSRPPCEAHQVPAHPISMPPPSPPRPPRCSPQSLLPSFSISFRISSSFFDRGGRRPCSVITQRL